MNNNYKPDSSERKEMNSKNDCDIEDEAQEYLTVGGKDKVGANAHVSGMGKSDAMGTLGTVASTNKLSSGVYMNKTKSINVHNKETNDTQANKKTQSNYNTQQNIHENFEKISSSKSMSKLMSTTSSNLY